MIEIQDALKDAYVAGCVDMLRWTNAGMPQDDLDEAGYDYAAQNGRDLEAVHAQLLADAIDAARGGGNE